MTARHLGMEELLAERDGTGTASSAEHLRDCRACRLEVERLHQVRAQLKALPSQGPPRDLWPRVRDRISAERERRARRRTVGAVLGVAALLVALVGLASLFEARERTLERRELELALVDLQERSQILEGELRSLRERSLSSWRAEAILFLEDELQEVDARLFDLETMDPRVETAGGMRPEAAGEQLALWLSRLELQRAMVDLHVAPVTQVDL